MDSQKVLGELNRKHVSIGMAKLLTELDVFVTDPNLVRFWPQLLQCVLAVFELEADSESELSEHFIEIEDQSTYQASAAVLVFATKKPVDIMAEIKDPKLFLTNSLVRLSQTVPDKIWAMAQQMDQQAQNILSGYLTKVNINL